MTGEFVVNRSGEVRSLREGVCMVRPQSLAAWATRCGSKNRVSNRESWWRSICARENGTHIYPASIHFHTTLQ